VPPGESSRAATSDDLGRIADLAAQLVREASAIKGGTLWGIREARAEPYEQSYGSLLDREDTCILVGSIDDVVVGFGVAEIQTLRTGQALGVISDLYVEPEARAIGVGEELLVELLEFCRSFGCIGVDASALPGDRMTKNFFEGHGFTARALVMHRATEPSSTRA